MQAQNTYQQLGLQTNASVAWAEPRDNMGGGTRGLVSAWVGIS